MRNDDNDESDDESYISEAYDEEEWTLVKITFYLHYFVLIQIINFCLNDKIYLSIKDLYVQLISLLW